MEWKQEWLLSLNAVDTSFNQFSSVLWVFRDSRTEGECCIQREIVVV